MTTTTPVRDDPIAAALRTDQLLYALAVYNAVLLDMSPEYPVLMGSHFYQEGQDALLDSKLNFISYLEPGESLAFETPEIRFMFLCSLLEELQGQLEAHWQL